MYVLFDNTYLLIFSKFKIFFFFFYEHACDIFDEIACLPFFFPPVTRSNAIGEKSTSELSKVLIRQRKADFY